MDVGALIVGTVHDEIIIEVSAKMADDTAAILPETMIEAAKDYLSRVPVEVAIDTGDTWAGQNVNKAWSLTMSIKMSLTFAGKYRVVTRQRGSEQQ